MRYMRYIMIQYITIRYTIYLCDYMSNYISTNGESCVGVSVLSAFSLVTARERRPGSAAASRLG